MDVISTPVFSGRRLLPACRGSRGGHTPEERARCRKLPEKWTLSL